MHKNACGRKLNMKKQIGSKLLACLLVFVLLFTSAPFGAFATEMDTDTVSETELISDDNSNDPATGAADSPETQSAPQGTNDDPVDTSAPSDTNTDVPASTNGTADAEDDADIPEQTGNDGAPSDENNGVSNEPDDVQPSGEVTDPDEPSAADTDENENSGESNENDAGNDTAGASETNDNSTDVNGDAETNEEGTGNDTDDLKTEGNAEPDETDDSVDETADDDAEADTLFSASIKVVVNDSQTVYMGETVTLKAEVTDANSEYSIRWESHDPASDIEGEEPVWNTVSRGREYSFYATQAAVLLEYRAVVHAEQGEIASKVVHITAIERAEGLSTEDDPEIDGNDGSSEGDGSEDEPSVDDPSDEIVTDQEDTPTDGNAGVEGDDEDDSSDITDPAEENETDEKEAGDDGVDNTDAENPPVVTDGDAEDKELVEAGSGLEADIPGEDNAEDEDAAEEGGDDADYEVPDEPEDPEADEESEENDDPDAADNPVSAENGEGGEPDEGDEPVEAAEGAEGNEDAADGDVPETVTVEETIEVIETYVPGGDGKNEELLTGYVEKLFGLGSGQKRLRSAYSVGASLTGKNAELYSGLKSMAAAVACGSQTSTQYTTSGGQFGPWTASDLNVGSIFNAGGTGSTTEAENAAWAKAKEQLGIDLSAVTGALLSDCPYELYWYDKTKGTSLAYGYSTSCRRGATTEQDTISINVTRILCKLSVATAYRDNGNEYAVDASLAIAAHAAVANVQNILDAAVGMTVTEKLNYFKTAICGLVTYNHEAADNDNTPYGDPWQLVWVFDGNPTTNVVCEGYSKAFKYLCDQVGIQCLLVSGVMSGATGAGAHMWNLVRLDGYSYLVDVTNSDEGSVGSGGELFMATVGTENDWNPYTIIGVTYRYDDKTISRYGQELLTVKRTGQGSDPETYTIAFNPADGTGSMDDVPVQGESIYQLPVCGFEAPEGMQFKEWSVVIGTAAAVLKAPGEEIMVDADTTVTAIWDLPAPVFEGHAILLTGQIGLQFFLKLPDGKTAADYPGSYVTFAGNKVNSTATHAIPSRTEEINGIDSGKYLFAVNLSSIQMADKITPTFHYTEGGTEKTVNGEPYSVKDYISWALGAGAGSLTSQQSSIIPKLADYGHYAQIYLSRQNNWTIGTSYAEMMTYLTNSYNYSTVMSATQGSAFSRTETSTQVTSVNYRLSLGSTITLTVRILPATADLTLADINAPGGSKSQSGEYFMVTYPGVFANQLADTRTITAGDCTITVSPMSYVYEMLSSETEQNDVKDLMCALHYYAQACN